MPGSRLEDGTLGLCHLACTSRSVKIKSKRTAQFKLIRMVIVIYIGSKLPVQICDVDPSHEVF